MSKLNKSMETKNLAFTATKVAEERGKNGSGNIHENSFELCAKKPQPKWGIPWLCVC